MPYSQGLSNNPYPEPNQSIFHVDIYVLIVLSSYLLVCVYLPRSRFPVGLPVRIFKALAPSSIMSPTTYTSPIDHPGYIGWMVQYMKFLTVKLFSLLPSLLVPDIPFRFSFQIPVLSFPPLK